MSYVARWDGATWSALDNGVGLWAYALAVFDDGNGPALYVGGYFTSASGIPANRVARWDGADWSALGSGVGSTVQVLATYDPPGSGQGPGLYVGGHFTTAGGAPANRIARWDGTAWSPLGTGTNDTVWALAVFDDRLYAAGEFTTAGGITANRIAEWDGTAWSSLGTGMNEMVYALTTVDLPWEQNQSALFVGGPFTTAGGVRSAGIAQWHRDPNDCNHNGLIDDCDLDCNSKTVPDECETASATLVGAVSRKQHDSPISANQDIAISLNGHVEQGNVTSESRQNGITELRLRFDVTPGGPCGAGPNPLAILEQACDPCPCGSPGAQAGYGPSGLTPSTAAVAGNELVLTFSPGLPNKRTYRIEVGLGVTSLAGQTVEVRGLIGDVNSSARVDAADRSLVVAYWTSPGYSIETDLDLSGETSASDRSIVVSQWTGTACAP